MQRLNVFKNLYFSYLAIVLLAFLLVLVQCKYEHEIIFNVIENCLFALVLVSFSLLVRNHKIRRFCGLIAYVGFSVMLILETLYYLLFKVFVSASTLYLVFDSNSDESIEFLESYIGFHEIVSAVILFCLIIFSLKKLNKQYQTIASTFSRYSLQIILIIIISIGYLKFSTHIIYNLPYLFAKSYVEYSEVSKNLEDYANNPKGNFRDATSPLTKDESGVFVLILGESTVRSNLGIYGYQRQTTPNLSKLSDELWIYNDVISSNSHTIESVSKMLTLGNYENPNLILQGSIVQLANTAGFQTHWLSNQRPIGMYESLITKMARSSQKTNFLTTMHGRHNRILDESLLPELNTLLESPSSAPKFIVIHLAGTHMLYQNRYPENQIIFRDNPPNIRHASPSNIKTVNHYDNAVYYNDFIIRSIIEQIKQLNTQSAVLYVSDHGEELFQDADFAGHNEDVATKSMYEVPFILWQSEDYKKEANLTYVPDRSYMTDDFFHSMANLLQIKSNVVDSTRSIFSEYFRPRKRLLLNDKNYDTTYSQSRE